MDEEEKLRLRRERRREQARQYRQRLRTKVLTPDELEQKRVTARAKHKRWRARQKGRVLTPEQLARTRARAREKSRRYRIKHRDKVLTKQRESQKLNYAARYAKIREWNARNPELFAKYQRDHYLKVRRERPWVLLIRGAATRARQRGLEFCLTAEWAAQHWTGCCEVTKVPFVDSYCGGPGPYSPTIDRIDQSLGYTTENSRFVLFCVNSFKNIGSDARMRWLARRILDPDFEAEPSYGSVPPE